MAGRLLAASPRPQEAHKERLKRIGPKPPEEWNATQRKRISSWICLDRCLARPCLVRSVIEPDSQTCRYHN